MATEGSGGSEKPATAATPTAPDSSTLSLPQQSPAAQEHAPTRSTPVQVLEDAMSGRRSESAPRVPASDVRLQGAADTAPIEEGEGSQQTSAASGSTSTTLALAGSSPTPQGQAPTRSEDALGGRSIESASRVPASDVLFPGGGFIFQAPRVSDGVLRGGGFVFHAPRDPAPDQPARGSQLFVPGGDNIHDTDIAHIRTLIAGIVAGIAASASDTKTPPASDCTTLALTQSSSAQLEHGITSSPRVHVPADAISGRSESAFLPGPHDALFCPPPASLQPRRDVGVIGGGRPARATAGDPEMRLVPFRGDAPHASMALLRQPVSEVSTMVVRMAPRTLSAPLGSAGSLQWRQHAPHVGGAPFVQLEPGLSRMMGMGMEWTTGQPWRQHVGHGPPGAQLQLHHAQSPLHLEHGRHHLAPTRQNNRANFVQISLEPALTRMMGTGQETGPLAAMLQQERAQLLQMHQQYHAGSTSTPRLELEQAREHRQHHLALASTRHSNRANFVQISRDDVQRGWDELQARRWECEELRRNNYLLQKECWDLHQALRRQQTPPSSSGSGVAGERPSAPCADCSGPAKVSMELCGPCYQRRQDCPCCRFDLY